MRNEMAVSDINIDLPLSIGMERGEGPSAVRMLVRSWTECFNDNCHEGTMNLTLTWRPDPNPKWGQRRKEGRRISRARERELLLRVKSSLRLFAETLETIRGILTTPLPSPVPPRPCKCSVASNEHDSVQV